jgi:hypothetical protein
VREKLDQILSQTQDSTAYDRDPAEDEIFGAQQDPELIGSEPGKLATYEEEDEEAKIFMRQNPAFKEDFEGPEGAGVSAVNTGFLTATGERWNRADGFLSSAAAALTIPQDFFARQTIAMFNGLGALSDEEAKKMLSSEDFVPSDLVNYYWKTPPTVGPDGVKRSNIRGPDRKVIGFALDLLYDPLNFLGVGALTKAGKAANIAGKTVSNLDKVSKGERVAARAAERLTRILTEDGRLVAMGENAAESTIKNTGALQDFVSGKITTEELKASLVGVDKAEVDGALRYAEESEKYLNQVSSGKRGLTVGFGVPFTNVAKEWDIPFTHGATQMGGKAAQFVFKSVQNNNLVQSVAASKAFKLAALKSSQLFSNTGWGLFDDQVMKRHGARSYYDELLKKEETGLSELLDGATEQEMADILDELEKGDIADPGRVLKAFDKKAYEIDEQALSADLKKQGLLSPALPGQKVIGFEQIATPIKPTKEYQMLQRTEQDLLRLQRMPEKHLQAARTMRKLLDEMAEEYRKRPGITFKEVNPFGPGWARTYLKHKVTTEYMEMAGAQGKLDDIINSSLGRTGKYDAGAKGREYRGTIREANLVSLEKDGLKIYEDDPVKLTLMRLREMDRHIQNYDLMNSAVSTVKIVPSTAKKVAKDAKGALRLVGKGLDEESVKKAEKLVQDAHGIPDGYSEFDLDQFQELSFKADKPRVDGKVVGEDTYAIYVPEFYRLAHQRGDKILMPSRVYDDLLNYVNPEAPSAMVDVIKRSTQVFNTIFRNSSTFGTGYLGQNFFGNLLNYYTAGHGRGFFGATKDLAEGLGVLTPNSPQQLFKYKNAMGDAMVVDKQGMYELMLKHNVIHSSYGDWLQQYDLAENISGLSDKGKKLATMADVALLWAPNRWIATQTDNITKAGYFINRLKAGFTPQGAAEAVDRYFYQYNKVGQTADVARQVMPFSTFPIKTMERVLDEFKSGHLGKLALPGKVQNVLSGAFVPDRDLRNSLNESLGPFQNFGFDPIHGPLLPGGYELQFQIPWAYDTLNFALHPENNLHPLLQMIFASLTVNNDVDYNYKGKPGVLDNPEVREVFGMEPKSPDISTGMPDFESKAWQTLRRVFPATIRKPLELAVLNGLISPSDPGIKALMKPYEPSFDGTKNSLRMKNFESLYDLGTYLEQENGKDWLFKSFHGSFPGRISEDSKDPKDEYMKVTRASYIQKHFRDLSFGLVRMTNMDRNYMIYRGGLKREKDKMIAQLDSDIERQALLVDPRTRYGKAQAYKLETWSPAARKITELELKIDTLEEYYDWYLDVQKNYPNSGVLDFILGADNYQVPWEKLRSMKEDGRNALDRYDPRKINIDEYIRETMSDEELDKVLRGESVDGAE